VKTKPTRPPGRPTPLAAAQHRIAELEYELARERERTRAAASGPLDPRALLEEIARDSSAPPMARVSAARALLKMEADAGGDVDALTARALKMGGHDGTA
jgi:hypothetical protein